ncbi:MAG: MFS transporter [Deltaproteobacteria bacterium]|nr:MFS transporter [Deltaproteobacteria bacterium]
MAKKIKFPKIYFGWWTVLASGLLALWGHGFNAYGISALFKPIASELGFSRTMTSVASSIGRLEGGLEAPLTGWITDRFGPKWIVFSGTFLVSLSLVLMYFIHSLWGFYVVWGLMLGTGVNTALSVPLDASISKWFIKKRGVALSIKWVFSGASGAVVLPLIAWMIATTGWRSACLIGGLVMGCIGLPLVLLCFKSHPPEYYGLLPDGATLTEKNTGGKDLPADKEMNGAQEEADMIRKGIAYAAEVSELEFTIWQALKTPAFWLLVCVQAVHGLVAPAINIHCISFLTDRGISPIVAAGMQAIMIGCSIPARMIGGFIADRIQKESFRFCVAGAYILQGVGIGIFLFHQTLFTIYLWFILYGIGMGAAITLNPSMRARYFGRKAFGTIQGTSMMLLTPIGIAAPIYAGWIYDTTGSYLTAFSLFTGLLGVASLILFFVRPPKTPETVRKTI